MFEEVREVKEELQELYGYLKEIAYAQLRTEKNLAEFIEEMSDFKNEMQEYKKTSAEHIKSNEAQTAALSNEMKDFKDEMKDFKDEMKDFKDEMKDFKDEMKDFKGEMKEFKDEMGDFKDEMSGFKKTTEGFFQKIENERLKETKKWNKKWGELSNKMGSIVEDIISPASRPVIEKQFKDEIISHSLNVSKKDKKSNLESEYDIISVSETCLYLFEVKTTARDKYLDDFIDNIEKFKQLFPEYKDKKLVPIFSGLRFDQRFVNLATKKQIYVMAYREWEYMDILNFKELKNQK